MKNLKNEIGLEIAPYENVNIDFGLGSTLSVPIAKYAQLMVVKYDCCVTIRSTSVVRTALRMVGIIEVLAGSHLISRRYVDRVIRRYTMRLTTGSLRMCNGWTTI